MAKKEVAEIGWGETALADMSFSEMLDAGVIDIAEIDDIVQCEQSELVGVPFILFDWDIKQSQTFGGQYAVCRVKTASGTRVFSDGGAGIGPALERYKQTLIRKGLDEFQPTYFHFGLRASTYMTEIDGKPAQATTFYFDNRPRP